LSCWVNEADPVATVSFWGERESVTVERRSRNIVTLMNDGPALQENHADHTKSEVSKLWKEVGHAGVLRRH